MKRSTLKRQSPLNRSNELARTRRLRQSVIIVDEIVASRSERLLEYA
jgi:hypothetical protein